MSGYDYDLFTIGGGSGGVRAARISGTLGARVGLAEERYLGGTCVNVGCVPKKLFVYASHVRHDIEDARGYGWTIPEATFSWPDLIANKNREIGRLNGVYRTLLDNAGVDIFDDRAQLLDPHTVRIGERTVTAQNILVATGGWPVVPPVPGGEHAITSNEAFFLDRLPERIVIVGGGYIAIEFAAIFHGLGSHVTLIYRGSMFLRGFDDDLRAALAAEIAKSGIDVRFLTKIDAIEKGADGLVASLDNGQSVTTDTIFYATGRHPLTSGLGLEAAGVALDDVGAVVVDDYSRSSVEHIYAVGDATNRLNLTPVAIREGQAVANTLFGGRPTKADHTDVPTAVFSQPAIATVGLSEAEARERYDAVDIYRASFRPLKHTLSGRDEKTLVKLVVDRATDRVVGCHMMGAEAADTIQGLAVAITCGATKAQFDATVGIHPTSAEEFVTLRDPAEPAPRPVGTSTTA
jgi:glutathione reductase (NADPH)